MSYDYELTLAFAFIGRREYAIGHYGEGEHFVGRPVDYVYDEG